MQQVASTTSFGDLGEKCHVDGDILWPLLRCVLPKEGPGSRQSGPSMCIFSGRGFAICRTSV